MREALLDLWGQRCALCGADLPLSLLRASHTKPWALANDNERLDPFNSLLLAVYYDALFDQGLISFDDNGKLLIAPTLSFEARQLLRLNDYSRLRFIHPQHRVYLDFHRKHIFNKS